MDCTCSLVVVAVVFYAALIEAAAPALSVSISPAHAHIHLVPSMRKDVRLTCDAAAAAHITDCQFKVGGHAPIDHAHVGTTDYAFDGGSGRCTVTLPWRMFALDGTYDVVGCRVRDNVSDWSYATMTVYSSRRSALALDVTAREVIAPPGSTAVILANSSTALETCSVLRATAWVSLVADDDVTRCEGRTCYRGGGLARGDCGAALGDVAERDNGRLWLRLRDKDAAEGAELVRLIVTKRPKSVNLEYSVTADKTLKAWCSVIGGRPTPDVTWYIAGVEITEGVVSTPAIEWAWPEDEKTLNQSLTRKLGEFDAGKELKCTASYMPEGKTFSGVRLIAYEGDGIPSIRPPVNVDVVDSPSIRQRVNVGVSDSPENIRDNDNRDAGYGTAACVLFALGVFMYVAVICLADFTVFAWRRQLWCFRWTSYESGASLDNDVMDYHATMPPRVTKREADERMESYLEPIRRQGSSRDSYFLPATAGSNRVSTKAERTLGLELQSRRTKLIPTPRYVQHAPSKKHTKSSTATLKKAAMESLFMPTPVDQLDVEEQGAATRYQDDELPIYGNMLPDATSDPPLYVNLAAVRSVGAVYGNLDATEDSGGRVYNCPRTTDEDAADQLYENITYPDDEPVYGNF